MAKTHTPFLFAFLMFSGQISYGQSVKKDSIEASGTNIDTLAVFGKYEGAICFRINECCTLKLLLEKNHTYVINRSGNNHGRKNKSTARGKWFIEGNFLVLTQMKPATNTIPSAPERYEIIKGDLWLYSTETLQPIEMAMKRK